MHPIDTYNYISKAISDSYERDVINGDAKSRAEWFSYAITTLGLSVVGTKGVGSVSKTGMASTKVATKTTVNQVTGATKKVPSINLLPYTPRNKFAYANLGAPYNVIDGTSLKDKLLSMVTKENKWSKEEIASSIPPYKPSKSLKNYSVEDFTKEMANLPHARIPTEIKNEIIEIPKGQKPEPNMYMSSTEIEVHLSLFKDGAVRIQSKESFEKAIKLYGSNIGDPATGTFVLPKSVVNKAVEASNGNPRILEDLLGLDPGYLGKHPIILNINNPSNIRIPSGNEAGAWPEYWIPGGYTSGGVPEAVVNQIPAGGYTILDIYPEK